MRYVHAPNGVFDRTLGQNEVYEFSDTIKQSPKRLTEDEKLAVGVSLLTLVTPPPFSRDTEQLQEVDPVLVDGVWTQQWSVVPTDPEELSEFIN